jgi:hypothetical protein
VGALVLSLPTVELTALFASDAQAAAVLRTKIEPSKDKLLVTFIQVSV